MPETMTEVQVLCPSCSRQMNSVDDGWQCLACHPIPMNVQKCKTQICKRPLTRLGDPSNCCICLHCNTHPSKVSSRQTEHPERKYIDQPMTEKRVKEIAGDRLTAEDVRSIVIEAMAEFSSKPEDDPDYPPPRAEINQMAESVLPNATPVETWLQKAKRLGVRTHNEGTGGMRKKVEIMSDMERLGEPDAQIPEELRPEEQG